MPSESEVPSEQTALAARKAVETGMVAFNSNLAEYLTGLSLPTANILAPIDERRKIVGLIPEVISVLTPGQKAEAFYLSKFAAACGVGLFDAALNYLWDATVMTLRDRVVLFDLAYFYDVTLSNPTERAKYKSVEDLVNLSDWDLIRGCREIGLLSDIAYSQLDFIREMRNYASAAHPNLNEITGIGLAAWLETCLRNVQAAPAEGPLMDVKRLLTSLRTWTLDANSARPIQTSVKGLPQELAHSLLQAVFGMYVDLDISGSVRTNIDLISASVWGRSTENARRGIGIKYATLAANGETQRADLARQFLSAVGGLGYLPTAQLTVEMTETIGALRRSHFAYNNFFNEEPHARTLVRLIPPTGEIPADVVESYVRTVVVCRLGNRYGVAFTAQPYYDQMLGLFRNQEIVEFIESVDDRDVVIAIADRTRAASFSELAKRLESKTSNLVFLKALRAIATATPDELRDPAFRKRVLGLMGS